MSRADVSVGQFAILLQIRKKAAGAARGELEPPKLTPLVFGSWRARYTTWSSSFGNELLFDFCRFRPTINYESEIAESLLKKFALSPTPPK
jgi:hypothetical protein